MKLHHLLQKCSFFLIKLAVLAAGLNSEPQNIEYRTAACDESFGHELRIERLRVE